MWLINDDRTKAINTESKVELSVETMKENWLVKYDDFTFAVCKNKHDAIETMITITILSMDMVIAKTQIGMTYKKCGDIGDNNIDGFIQVSVKDIIERGQK